MTIPSLDAIIDHITHNLEQRGFRKLNETNAIYVKLHSKIDFSVGIEQIDQLKSFYLNMSFNIPTGFREDYAKSILPKTSISELFYKTPFYHQGLDAKISADKSKFTVNDYISPDPDLENETAISQIIVEIIDYLGYTLEAGTRLMRVAKSLRKE